MLDIHTHILPEIDDGAKSVEEAVELIKILKSQGISRIVATPHFYPQTDNLEDFLAARNQAFLQLKDALKTKDMPEILLGCELLYYEGISLSEDLGGLCLNQSDFLLLELTDGCINNALFNDLERFKEKTGITPIIAHIERYCKAKNYRKLLKLVKLKKIPVQINAESVLIPFYRRTVKKLLTGGFRVFLASDTHSLEKRPPHMKAAIDYLTVKYDKTTMNRLISNLEVLNILIEGGNN